MVGLVIIKVLAKIGVVIAKKSALRKASILGVVVASGAEELVRKKKFEKPKYNDRKFKNEDNEIEII